MQRRGYLWLVMLGIVAGIARPAGAQAVVVGAPVGPEGIQAYPRNASALVTWLAPSDLLAVGFNLYRRSLGQSADKAVLVNTSQVIATTFAVDTGLTNGNGYVYFVKPVYKDASGKLFEGSPSRDALVMPSAPVMAAGGAFYPYTIDTDYLGGVTVNGTTLTIRGSGANLSGLNDGQTFLAAPVAGDFTATVTLLERPSKETNAVSDLASVGLEVRSDLQVRDTYAIIAAAVTHDPEYHFDGRRASGVSFAVTTRSPSSASAKFPVVLRLIRKGTMLQASFSENNGATFTILGSAEDLLSLPPVVYVGLAADAHGDGTFVDGKFDLSSFTIK